MTSPTLAEAHDDVFRHTNMVLPPDIMGIVLGYCDLPERSAVMHTCRDYHAIAVPHVYRKIVISNPRQLRSFISTAQQAEFDDRIARQFYHTRAFEYRVMNGSSAVSSTKVKQPKLYTSLRDVPSHTSKAEPMFPNLDTAVFEQVPAMSGEFSYKTTFLSEVKTVALEHSPMSLYDCPPDFHTLGMRDIREVHMHHLAGCEVSNESYLGTFLNYQASLEKLYFHLSDHFLKCIGSESRNDRGRTLVDGLLEVWAPTRPRRSIDTTIYIHEYADAVAMVSASVAYAQITASSRYHRVYPALQQVVIDIGVDRDSALQALKAPPPTSESECTDRQLLLRRCKRVMLRYRNRAERQHIQGVHIAQEADQKKNGMPDMCILEGDAGTRWLLTNRPLSGSSTTGFDKPVSAAWLQPPT